MMARTTDPYTELFSAAFLVSTSHIEVNTSSTGCKSPNDTLFKINILKEALLVEKQTIPQQKVLDLSFNLAPRKWEWHYHEAATPS